MRRIWHRLRRRLAHVGLRTPSSNQDEERRGVNPFWQQLTPEEIAAGAHREFVGGLWDEIGRLQLEYMRSQGLRPNDRLLDVGCGALRGGLHFVRYLDAGNYYGLDINASLIEAGRLELERAGLADKGAHLEVEDRFDASQFKVEFDYAIALSLFTHLFANQIVRCLIEVMKALRSGGEFHATFFEAPRPGHLSAITHSPGEVRTCYDSDPFHYSLDEFQAMAEIAGLTVERIGEWGHPRGQRMLSFRS